ncbi:MAG: toprim domain-containing protein [Oscillospiraceae bacterium]
MNEKITLVPAVVVEGKYDKICIHTYFDCTVIVTDGFRIYKRPAQLELIRHYARTVGVVILTDADAAGFQIRGYLKGAITEGKLYHVYIPGIHGKEKRKAKPSAEGTLGVEGMDRETLMAAFARAGLFDMDAAPRQGTPITPALLYEYDLTGYANCSMRRKALLEALHLPCHLSVNGLCEVLSTMTTAEAFGDFLAAHLPREGGT